MAEEVSTTVEEYLEGIYRLQEKNGSARTSELVKLLKVAPGSVTNTVERLEREGYIMHEPYKGVKLTERGRKIALRVIRIHRLSERLLTDILHVEWHKAHKAACELEHAIADDIVKNLEKALGHPRMCPHGNPIPTKRGKLFEDESKPLADLNPAEKGIMAKITEEEADLLQYLATLGLKPGAHVEIVEKAPFNGPITVKVDGTSRAISRGLASIIKVKKSR
jgi:DtxR family Mn-dependent transcriptional regulator